MWIYIVNFVLILIYGFLIKNKKVFVTLASLQLFLILALRDPLLGVDNAVYKAGYEYIAELSFGDMLSRLHLIKTADLIYPFAFEGGYTLINWVTAFFGIGFHGFLIIHAAFCIFVTGKFIYKYSDNPTLSFILFISLGFFTYLFGILRQTLAMAVFMMSIPFIKERKPLKYFLLCLVAFTIHRVAIITVPLYFIYNVKISQKRYVRLGLALIAFLAVSPLLVRFAVKPILQMIGKTSYQLSFSINSYIIVMVALAILILMFTRFENFTENNPENNFLCWCFLFAIAIEIVGLYNDVIARAMYTPYISIIVLIPNVLKRYKHSGISTIGKILLVCGCFAFMVWQLSGDFINPYVFFFE